MLPQPIKKQENRFIVGLNKKMYRKDIVDKAVSDDKDWVRQLPIKGPYLRVELETKEEQEVLKWMNDLLYLHRVS